MIQNPIVYLFKELKITIATVLVIVALLLVSLRLITPYIPTALPGLKYWVEYQIKTPVSIDELEIVWIGSKPAIRFRGLTLLDEKREHSIIDSETVDILLSPLDSIINGRFIIDAIVIDHASLRIEPDTVSRLSDTSSDDDEFEYLALIEQANAPVLQFGTAWVDMIRGLPIERVIIKNSDIHFKEANGESWPLTNVTASVARDNDSVKLRAVSTLLGGKPAEFFIGADISKAFTAPSGQVVVSGQGFDLDKIQNWFGTGVAKTSEGTVGLSVWTSLDNGYWNDVKIELTGEDVLFVSDSGLPLDRFSKINGQLLWKKDDTDYGWQLYGREFNVLHSDIKNWIPAKFKLTQYGTSSEPEFDFKAHQLQLNTWLPFLLRTNWLPKQVHTVLNAYDPEGIVDYLNINLTKLNQHMPRFNIQFSGDNLGLTQPDIGYRFENINVRLDMDNVSGTMEVVSPKITYAPVEQSQYALTLDNWQTQIFWYEFEDGWKVQLPWLHAGVGQGQLSLSGGLQLDTDGNVEHLGALMATDKIEASDILKRFPIGFKNTNFRDWLTDAQPEGNIDNLILLYRGTLKGFKNQEDTLRLKADLSDVGLHFQPAWPRLSGINGTMQMLNLTFDLDVNKAKFGDVFDLSGKAVIPDVDDKKAFVVADAHVVGQLEDISQVLAQSPLKSTIDEIFEQVSPEGKLDLDMTINASFDSNGPVTLRALLDLDDATIHSKTIDGLNVHELSGDIAFSDTNLRANNLKGKLGDQEFNSTINMVFSGDNPFLDFKAESWLDSDNLEKWVNQRLPVTGVTPFELSVQMPLRKVIDEGELGRFIFQSDLVGLGLDLPEPLGKPMEEKRSLSITSQIQSSDALGMIARLEGVASLAGRVSNTEKGWEPTGVHLHFSPDKIATFPQERELLVDGHLSYINVESWQDFISEMVTPLEDNATQRENQTLQLKPVIDLTVDMLDLWGIPVQELGMKAEPESEGWQIEANAPIIAGTLWIPENILQSPIELDLKHLRLPSSYESDNELPTDTTITPKEDDVPTLSTDVELPNINAKISQLTWRDLDINAFDGKLVRTNTGYRYHFKADSKPLSFDLEGQWEGFLQYEPMSAYGFVQTRDFGDLLNKIHTKSAIKDAAARVDVDLTWLGGVTNPNIPTFSGTVQSSLRSGRVLGVEPGLGRILSLLSLSNIQRRLTLDFSDITKEGFAFDRIDASILLDKGFVSTDNFELRGPIANLDIQGKIDLKPEHEITAQMDLTPNLESSLPIAATIASGNPAIGAFLWAFDKVVGNDISEIIHYRYAITGNWLEPQIEELEVIHEKPGDAQ